MSELTKPPLRFIDLITPETSKEDLEALVKIIITPKDTDMFGENASNFILQALLYPAAFAPLPSVFDSEAYAFVIDDLFSEQKEKAGMSDKIEADPDRINRLLNISIEQGIIEIDENKVGKLFVHPHVRDKILPLLEKFN